MIARPIYVKIYSVKKMTCDGVLSEIKKEYSLVKLLSDKNDSLIMQMRHKRAGRDIVLRKYRVCVPAYDFLKGYTHKNLPEIYDTYNCEDGQIVLEEFIGGITVAEVLESGRYTVSGALKILNPVCCALEFLHMCGIVHRDIKPENIIVSDKGEVKLIDLNASRLFNSKKTGDTVALGTVGYASPEQFGITQSDLRADIYSLGILLNVMLTGKHPSEKLAHGRYGRIVLKCTQIDPSKRYQSIGEFLYNL